MYTCMYVQYSWPGYTCIKQMFTYTSTTVCLLVRSCCLTQRYQSKSLNEISPNPMGPRDRQSTLRFEKSISAVWKNKSWCQTKVVGIILKTSNLVSELLDSHCKLAPIHLEKKYFTLNKWRSRETTTLPVLRKII